MGWKQDFANEAEKAYLHPIAQDVIDEFLGNIGRSDAIVRYGIGKVCGYVAQIARAQALGLDPEVLRLSDEEAVEHMARVMQIALDAGKPVIVVEAPESDS